MHKSRHGSIAPARHDPQIASAAALTDAKPFQAAPMPRASPESPEEAPKHAKPSLLILRNRTSNFGFTLSEMLLKGSRPAHEGVGDTSNDLKDIYALCSVGHAAAGRLLSLRQDCVHFLSPPPST